MHQAAFLLFTACLLVCYQGGRPSVIAPPAPPTRDVSTICSHDPCRYGFCRVTLRADKSTAARCFACFPEGIDRTCNSHYFNSAVLTSISTGNEPPNWVPLSCDAKNPCPPGAECVSEMCCYTRVKHTDDQTPFRARDDPTC